MLVKKYGVSSTATMQRHRYVRNQEAAISSQITGFRMMTAVQSCPKSRNSVTFSIDGRRENAFHEPLVRKTHRNTFPLLQCTTIPFLGF